MNMSFSLTTQAILDETKDVTRRLGWLKLKPGQIIHACKKCMGRKPGEPLVRLKVIRVKSVRREALYKITQDDVRREGFPGESTPWFIVMFCKSHKGCTPETVVTRIEFEYVK